VWYNKIPKKRELTAILLTAAFGCSSAPPCPVTPIHIEETREDVKVLERDLAAARDRADKLKAELDEKKARLEERKDKPEELRQKLDELKKGSGRIEDETEDTEETDSTEDGKE
jgi:septal ring factor EnvC (AmiA/AmiB activator)